MSDPVLFETRDSVALLTLNRPEKLNALSYEVNDLLLQLLDRIEDDDGVRAVIVTGAGDRAFSAGADIHEFSETVKKGPEIISPFGKAALSVSPLGPPAHWSGPNCVPPGNSVSSRPCSVPGK
jgi:enoyl-CoA hydratase/carnithine racemase